METPLLQTQVSVVDVACVISGVIVCFDVDPFSFLSFFLSLSLCDPIETLTITAFESQMHSLTVIRRDKEWVCRIQNE